GGAEEVSEAGESSRRRGKYWKSDCALGQVGGHGRGGETGGKEQAQDHHGERLHAQRHGRKPERDGHARAEGDEEGSGQHDAGVVQQRNGRRGYSGPGYRVRGVVQGVSSVSTASFSAGGLAWRLVCSRQMWCASPPAAINSATSETRRTSISQRMGLVPAPLRPAHSLGRLMHGAGPNAGWVQSRHRWCLADGKFRSPRIPERRIVPGVYTPARLALSHSRYPLLAASTPRTRNSGVS